MKIDKEKAVMLAKEIGLKISFNKDVSGVLINGKVISFNEFFPCLKKIAEK